MKFNGIPAFVCLSLYHALVKADIEDRKITIAIDGIEHTRRDALSAIRYQLDKIHGSIKGLNPKKFVPMPGSVKAKPSPSKMATTYEMST